MSQASSTSTTRRQAYRNGRCPRPPHAWRVGAVALASIAALATIVLQPVAVASVAAAHLPADITTETDGCPSDANLPVDAGVVHCNGWSVSFDQQQEASGDGCVTKLYMMVPLSKTLNSWGQYVAVWTPPGKDPQIRVFTSSSGGPYNPPEVWSTTEITPATTTLPTNFTVPKGYGAWFVGLGGGSSGGCTPTPMGSAVAYVMAVDQHTHTVSGQVTISGSTQPAPGIAVRADCHSGGTTTTDSNGHYSFLLDKGPCTIAPQLGEGEAPIPTQREVDVGDSDITGVDFGVPEGLKVFVKPLEALRSGLAYHSPHYKRFPVDFLTTGDFSGSDALPVKCESGCVDLVVHVIDEATHKAPKPFATVSASLGDLELGVQVWDGRSSTPPAFGSGSLCVVRDDGLDQECGQTLDNVHTNADGIIYLRYWAPGVLAEARTTLTITASCEWSAPFCVSAARTSHTTLATKPYEIYHHDSQLSADTLSEMNSWAGGSVKFNEALEQDAHLFKGLTYSLDALEHFETTKKGAVHALEAIEDVEPLTLLIEAALTFDKVQEAEAMFAEFMDAAGLSPFGLGTAPFEASATGNPGALFVKQLMSLLAVPEVLKDQIGNGGFWWASAEDLHHVIAEGKFDPLNPDWSLEVSVYEVSHCDDQAGSCGPGYGNHPGSADVDNAGIDPQLVFELAFRHNGVTLEQAAFPITYDALAWAETQPDLEDVIQDN